MPPLSDPPIALKCQCYGIEDSMGAEEAFEAGWDAPPHFTQVMCCPLCPSVAVLGLIDHSAAHERWEKEGRPATFDEQMTNGDLPPLPVQFGENA
jgi:hypothetical protein